MKLYVIETKREYTTIEDGPGWRFREALNGKHEADAVIEYLRSQSKDKFRVRIYVPRKPQ